jgi:hypothetical protein
LYSQHHLAELLSLHNMGLTSCGLTHTQVQNFVRPLRFTLAVAVAPAFDRFITWTQSMTGWSRRNAFGAFLFLLGSVTSLLVFGSIAVFAGPVAFARS